MIRYPWGVVVVREWYIYIDIVIYIYIEKNIISKEK